MNKAFIRKATIILLAGLALTLSAAAQDSPQSTLKPGFEWKTFHYTCEGDSKLTVHLHNETVKVRFKDKTYLMQQVIAASGTRYSDGKIQWWSKGDTGFLQEDKPDGDGAMLIKDCKLDKAAAQQTVTGTVGYLARMALPPTAVIEVKLQDVSRMDAPAIPVGEETITLGDRQVPIPFSISYDPAKIDPAHTYAVSARITVDGRLVFITDTSYRVLTAGNPSRVDLILKPPAKPAPPSM